MKRRAIARLAEVAQETDGSPLHELRKGNDPSKGVITAGLPFRSLVDVLEDAAEKPDILKLGVVHPLPKGLVADFLRSHASVKVLEELDDVLEREIKALAFDLGIRTVIVGKTDPEDWIGTLPTRWRRCLRTWPPSSRAKARSARLPLPPSAADVPRMRSPLGLPPSNRPSRRRTSPSRTSAATLSVSSLPTGWGSAPLDGALHRHGGGLSLFNTTRKVVAFLGDSTFFHAGLPASSTRSSTTTTSRSF